MFRRTTAAVLLASTLGMSSVGCLGQMATSGKVMKFNLGVTENRWGRWVVFLILYIIPVYEIAALIDLIIVNSIEFHTGTNPLTDKPRIALREGAEEIVAPDGSRAVSTLNEDGTATLLITDTAGVEHYVRLVPVPGGIEAVDRDGRVLGRVDGDGNLTTKNGPVPLIPRT
jgi:hypothetical protein